jgi:hypothetical protein
MQPGGAAWSSSAAWPGSLDYAPGEKQAAHWEVRASCLLDRLPLEPLQQPSALIFIIYFHLLILDLTSCFSKTLRYISLVFVYRCL